MLALDHCKGHYYREFAYKLLDSEKANQDLQRIKSTPLRKDSDLVSMLSAYSTRRGLYVSVYSYGKLIDNHTIDYNSAKIDRIYLDFDHKTNPQKAIDEALLTVKALAHHGIFCHTYFTGNKGIALYIEFKTVEIAPENKKEVIAKFFDYIIEDVQEKYISTLETLDHQVRGDIARVSRLPNTLHHSGYCCIPVSFGEMRKGLAHIKKLAMSPREYDLENTILKNMVRNEKMPGIIRALERIVTEEKEYKKSLTKVKKQYYELQPQKKKVKTAGRITDADIEKAKTVPLSDYLGNDKMVVCPFHHDSNPSLSIDHSRGLWHCFGCGKGGTVIDFVMQKDGIDFKKAVFKLQGVQS